MLNNDVEGCCSTDAGTMLATELLVLRAGGSKGRPSCTLPEAVLVVPRAEPGLYTFEGVLECERDGGRLMLILPSGVPGC